MSVVAVKRYEDRIEFIGIAESGMDNITKTIENYIA